MLLPFYKNEIHQLVTDLSSIYDEKSAVYISAPITTGKDFIHWYKKNLSIHEDQDKYSELHRTEIMEKNSKLIMKFISNLRQVEVCSIIEPASLAVDKWSQADYLYYWELVIARYVKKIIFLNGWTYSRGCVYEYYIGLENKLVLVDQNNIIINTENAIFAIQKSISEYKANSIDAEFQQSVLNKIIEL